MPPRDTSLADPLPERRLARLLAVYIAAGLFFLVLPGTLIGVWNLLGISSQRNAGSVSSVWIQAHGHAQLFGWVGTFILGISLYTVPKFRGAWLRSLAVGWLMLFLWSAAVLARWLMAITGLYSHGAWLLSGIAEFAVVLLLLWQTTPSGPSHRGMKLWERLIFTGFGALAVTLGYQLAVMWKGTAQPVIPASEDRVLLYLAIWFFCFPTVWGFSTRFLFPFLGLEKPGERSAHTALVFLGGAFVFVLLSRPQAGAFLALLAVTLACWSLRIFHPAVRPAKVRGVSPLYPWFARSAYAWLLISALLELFGAAPGMSGASRHAFTVGFLAMLILSIGPRILPSFLNSRELYSPRLVSVSLFLLTVGCALRVTSEPLAYAGVLPAAWTALPFSAILEMSAILLFAWNIGWTLVSPMPAWIELRLVNGGLSLYWLISSYPETRNVLRSAGLTSIGRVEEIPRSLTLREAAEAQGAPTERFVSVLKEYFERRMAAVLRSKAGLPAPP